MSFKLEGFINNCLSAISGPKSQHVISDLVADAISQPESIFGEIGNSKRAMIERLYVSDELTIINVVWAPKMTLLPHNHRTWAVIGVYVGREDNIFWRQLKGDSSNKIEAAGAKSIAAGEVASLGKDVIHSVTNPVSGFTRAIHVYGGNFFEIERSEWEPLHLTERPYNVERNLGVFEAENEIIKFREK